MHMTQISAAKIPYLQKNHTQNELAGGLSAMRQRTVRSSTLLTYQNYQRFWVNLKLYCRLSAVQLCQPTRTHDVSGRISKLSGGLSASY